ncbi:MAG: DUF1284 domain-containing protein [Methanocella sp.]
MTTRPHPGRKGIPLRAHHLLCLLGFQGIGYTADFIRNFQKVKRLVEQNPDLEIEVVDSCDVVCIQCPNAQGSHCFKGGLSENRSVRDMDRRVMAKLDIRPGDRFKARDLFALIKEKIGPSDIRDLCRGCEWLSLEFCPRGLEKLSTLDMFADKKNENK